MTAEPTLFRTRAVRGSRYRERFPSPSVKCGMETSCLPKPPKRALSVSSTTRHSPYWGTGSM